MKRLTINIKELFDKYHHAWVFLYGFIYMPWFSWLEKHVTSNYFVIHSVFDDYIPFIEIFIIPYLLWFVYVSGTVLYFFFTDKQGFYRICTIFPNGLNLRPSTFARDNIFVDLVRFIYRADTSTNVLPSLHVYNSIGCYIAIRNSQKLRQYKWVQNGSLVLTVSIVLSTMFLKQHSVVDVIAAIVMIYFIYQFVYIPEQVKAPALAQPTI